MIIIYYKTDKFIIKYDNINNIYLINVISSKISKDDYINYHNKILGIYNTNEIRNTKFILIIKSTNISPIKLIPFSKNEAKFFKSLEERTSKIVVCIVAITKSKIIINIVNLLVKLYGSVIPYKLVNTIDDAIIFIKKYKTIKCN